MKWRLVFFLWKILLYLTVPQKSICLKCDFQLIQYQKGINNNIIYPMLNFVIFQEVCLQQYEIKWILGNLYPSFKEGFWCARSVTLIRYCTHYRPWSGFLRYIQTISPLRGHSVSATQGRDGQLCGLSPGNCHQHQVSYNVWPDLISDLSMYIFVSWLIC